MFSVPLESVLLALTGLALPAGALPILLLRQNARHKRFRRLQLARLHSLRDLILNLQRHRGLSTGLLSGDESMRAELANRRQHIDQIIRDAPMEDARCMERWSGIDDHWSRLRETARHGIDTNLTQHHRIIRNALFLIQDVAADDRVAPHPASRRCIWNEVLEAAEWSGQARALGTGMAAAGSSSAAQRVRMRFLSEKIRDLSDTAFEALETSPSTGAHRKHLSGARQAVSRLLNQIETELLADGPIVIPAKTYFQDATATVDALFVLVEDTLAAMADSSAGSYSAPATTPGRYSIAS